MYLYTTTQNHHHKFLMNFRDKYSKRGAHSLVFSSRFSCRLASRCLSHFSLSRSIWFISAALLHAHNEWYTEFNVRIGHFENSSSSQFDCRIRIVFGRYRENPGNQKSTSWNVSKRYYCKRKTLKFAWNKYFSACALYPEYKKKCVCVLCGWRWLYWVMEIP